MQDEIGRPFAEQGMTRRGFIHSVTAVSAGAAIAMLESPPASWAQEADATSATPLVRLEKITPQHWQVVIDNPPFNLVVPEVVSSLHHIVTDMDSDPDLKIIVFRSGVEGFFINHFDLARARDFPVIDATPPIPTWVDLVLRLSRSPVISIASIRGRTRGGGNEFALACDLRYASLGEAFFGQPEVGTGIVPGGGASERLPRLAGRDRALEVILSSQDYTAADAERFGLVTRALPDGELDAFVQALVTRISGFDKQALAAAKSQINRATLPPEADLFAAYQEYSNSLGWQGFVNRRPRVGALVAEHGIADFELRLGHYLGLAN